MSLYSDLAADVNELLTEFGQTVIVTSLQVGQADPGTGIVTRESTQFTTVGVVLDFDYRNFGESTVPYYATSASDKRLLLTAGTVVNSGDMIFVDGISYKCHVVKVVNPAGTRVLYDIWMQK